MKKNIVHHFASIGASIVFTLGASFGQVHAGVVTSSLDDGNLGSLRKVIATAASGETITFAPSLNGKTITLTNGQLVLTKNVQIVGPGAKQLQISGGTTTRVFYVATGVSATISGLTIANGNGLTPIPTAGGTTGGVALTNTGTNTLTVPTTVTGGTLVISAGTPSPGSATLTINAVGAGGLVKVGSGTLTLTGATTITGANTYTGSTTVNAGGLTLNTGTNSGTVSAISLPTTNVGALVTTGTGAVVLTNTNSYTVSTTAINGGTLTLNPGAVLTFGTNTVATNNLAVATGSGTLAVGGAAPGPTNAGAFTISGATTNNVGGVPTTAGAAAATGGSIVVANPSTTLPSGGLTLTTTLPSSGLTLPGIPTPASATGGTLVINGGATTSTGVTLVGTGNVGGAINGIIDPTGGTLGTTGTAGGTISGGIFNGNLPVSPGTLTGPGSIGTPGGPGGIIIIIRSTGAGIYNDGGNLTVSNCTIANNTMGAGIFSHGNFIPANGPAAILGSLKLINCTVSGNSGPVGGLHNGGFGSTTVVNSTIAGNRGDYAGAIYNDFGAQLTLSNSTVSGNIWAGESSPFSFGVGGVLMAGGAIVIYPGAIARVGSLVADNTIFSNNTTGNFSATLVGGATPVSNGYNLSDDNSMAAFLTRPNDLNNTPAGLDVDAQGKPRLQDNGGPTQTIALLPGSAAIDKGGLVLSPNLPPKTDQRGFPRIANGRQDIGAFETQTPKSLSIAVQLALQAIPATNDPTGHALRDVLDHLTSSLQSTFWVNDTHLSKDGHAVFDTEHFAADQLSKIVQAHGPRAADAQDWIDYLVNAGEVLAKVAIHDAAAGDPHKLAAANQEFTQAEQTLVQDKYQEAVDHFSHAWDQALQAIR